MKSKSSSIFLFISFLSLIYNLSYAQYLTDPVFYDLHTEKAFNRFPTISAGRGYTGIAGNSDENNFTNCLLNPAALNIKSKFSFAAEYTLRERQDIYYGAVIPEDDIEAYYDQLNPDLLIGGAYRINDKLSTAAFFMREKSFEQSETINYVPNYESVSQNTFGISVSYILNDILRVGTNLYYLMFKGNLENYNSYIYPNVYVNSTTDFTMINAQFGVIYSPNDFGSFGLSFSPSTKHDVKWTESELDAYEPFIMPAKVCLGLRYDVAEKMVSNYLDINFNIYGDSKYFKPSLDLNIGLEVKPVNNFILRAGFFSNSLNTDFMGEFDEYTSYYFTLGASYKYKDVSFNMTFLDNKFTNKNDYKVMMLQFGAGLEI